MDNPQNRVFYTLGQWCLVALAFLFPIWVLPLTSAPVEFNKALLVSIFVFLAFIFYFADSIKKGSVGVPWHWIFALLAVLLVSWLASAIFAGFSQSVWGGTFASTSFFDTFIFALLAVLIFLFFDDARSLSKLFVALACGLALFLLSVLLFSVFGWGPGLIGGIFASRAFNAMGSWNAVSFAASFLIVLLYSFWLIASRAFFWIMSFMLGLAVALMIYINFQLPIILLGLFALILLSHSIWKRNLETRILFFPLALILVALFVFLFSEFLTNTFNFPSPVEVSVLPSTTIRVASEAIKENVIFGSGPASFGYLWDSFKPYEVNNTVFWGVRFVSGYSYLLTLLGELGILAFLMFIVFLAALWYWSIKALAREEGELMRAVVFASFLLLSYTIAVWAVYSAGYSLVLAGFFSVGITLSVLRISGILRVREFRLLSEGPKGFLSAMISVFLILASIGGLYLSLNRYMGEVAYARGVDAFNALSNMDLAESYLLSAIRADESNDLYLRTLADLNLVRARLALQNRATPQEILGSRFKDALDKAISNAQDAVKNGGRDFQNFRSLGKIYELLVSINAAGAKEAAIAQYDEAIKRAPLNPILWRDKALVYLSDYSLTNNKESLELAEKALAKSTEIKLDYTEGHFLLAQVFDAKGEINEAIRRAEAAALLASNDIGTLFQLGLLYYRANRLADAEVVFKRATDINNSYSNARYFLGLIYDKQGKRADAIAEFANIERLNPDNGEVKRILENLKAGRGALETVSPPAQAPERRKEPPVKERAQ